MNGSTVFGNRLIRLAQLLKATPRLKWLLAWLGAAPGLIALMLIFSDGLLCTLPEISQRQTQIVEYLYRFRSDSEHMAKRVD